MYKLDRYNTPIKPVQQSLCESKQNMVDGLLESYDLPD
jgi:hypothetical protein